MNYRKPITCFALIIAFFAFSGALVGSVSAESNLAISSGVQVFADSDCVIPASGPWPPCATGGVTGPVTGATGDCVIPATGPWPPCATGGGGGGSAPVAGGGNACPVSGKWPPGCVPGGSGGAPIASGGTGDCVIPASGPWPPCATGGGGGSAPAGPAAGSGNACPVSGKWPPGCVPGGAPAAGGGTGDCVIPASGPWPPCATGGGGSTPTSSAYSITYRERFGVTGIPADAHVARNAGLNFGSFIDWRITNPANLPANTTSWQMIRVNQAGSRMSDRAVLSAIDTNKGATWVIGNEPDVVVQDNVTPERYAEIYHDLYQLIKSEDTTAQVAIAGVSSPTALRMQYLDRVLNAYQNKYGVSMPIDVWTVHVYVLREQRDSWGIGIPPGFDNVNDGVLHEIDDHKDHTIANQMIVDFRAFMNSRGYRQSPLAITEFGILLPADFGFEPEVVSNYMRNVVGFYLNTSNGTGFSADGNKLVQQWFWFSLYDRTDEFAVGNLLASPTGGLTAIGNVYAGYVR